MIKTKNVWIGHSIYTLEMFSHPKVSLWPYSIKKQKEILNLPFYALNMLITFLFRLDRQALNDVEYKGVKIPKGMTVTFPILALHMDPKVWPEPEKFDPDR